jgi:DNA polymerase-3 subunit alpha
MLQGLGTDPARLARGAAGAEPPRLPEPVRDPGARLDPQRRARAGVCKLEWLQELGEGLLLLSGAQAGPVGQALLQGDESRAAESRCSSRACSRTASTSSCSAPAATTTKPHVAAAVQLAARLNLPVVATHPVQFTKEDDYEAHEARVCISEGEILGNQRRVRKFTREQYFKSAGADGGAVRRPAFGRRQHAGDRAALQPGAGTGQAAPAELPHAQRHADRRVLPLRVA